MNQASIVASLFVLLAIAPASYAQAGNSPSQEHAQEEQAVNICRQRLVTPLNSYVIAAAQERGLIRTLGNALESSVDDPSLKFDNRCFWPMSSFGGFASQYYIQAFNALIFYQPFPYANLDGQLDQLNCPEALAKYGLPGVSPALTSLLTDYSPRTLAAIGHHIAASPDELKRQLNSYLGSSMTNYAQVRIEDITPDAAHAGCLVLKAVSTNASVPGGHHYNYGRNFRFCPDLKDTGCGDYFNLPATGMRQ